MTYFSPKTSIIRWSVILLYFLLFPIPFIKLAIEEKSFLVMIFPLVMFGFAYWLSKVLYLRVTKPSVQILNDKVVVQSKLGKFIEVSPFADYRLIFSEDFFAFRKGKENDITVELEHIKKNEFQELKAHLTKLPFLGSQNENQ